MSSNWDNAIIICLVSLSFSFSLQLGKLVSITWQSPKWTLLVSNIFQFIIDIKNDWFKVRSRSPDLRIFRDSFRSNELTKRYIVISFCLLSVLRVVRCFSTFGHFPLLLCTQLKIITTY